MHEFFSLTLTRQKFQGLFVNTALGNFAGYLAGSLVTVVSTYHSIERRALKNLFGILPRRKVVVHLLPEWLEWLLALVVGFLVMEFVRYWFNRHKYAALLTTHAHEQKHPPPSEPASLDTRSGGKPAGGPFPL
jgi:hypothetical protein